MPKRTSDHHSLLLKQLSDPEFADHYLNAAIEDSLDSLNAELFLKALRNVAEARRMSVERRGRKKGGD